MTNDLLRVVCHHMDVTPGFSFSGYEDKNSWTPDQVRGDDEGEASFTRSLSLTPV